MKNRIFFYTSSAALWWWLLSHLAQAQQIGARVCSAKFRVFTMRWYETILSFTCARPQHQRKGNTHEPTIYICDHLCPECVYGALEHNVFWHEHSCFVAFLVAFSVSLFVLIMWATAWVFAAFSLCLLVVWVHTVLITRCVLAVFTTVF